MKRKGFTLAEALIAIAIVGVITAMTIPNLVANYRKNAWASALSVAVSNFETAMTTMIYKEDVADLYQTDAWRNISEEFLDSADSDDSDIYEFVADIGKTIPLTFDANNKSDKKFYSTVELKTINKNTMTEFISNESFIPLKSKQGFVYFIYIGDKEKGQGKHLTEGKMYEYRTNLPSVAAAIIIDVNGKNKPNTVGRDIFRFVLGPEGKLYPYAGIDHVVGVFENKDKVWKKTGSDYECTNTTIKDPGWGCTARLVENGYKMDY